MNRSQGLSILVVEDDPDMRALLEGVLSSDGHHITGAADGQHALELTRALGFDLVLTDVQLPVMSGLDLFAKLRAEQPHVDVIVMTADAAVQDAVNALRDGAADYLTKPFDMTELRLRVKRIGDHLRLTKALESTRAALKERIGSYQLEEQIGEGAMGVVYRASHVMLRRPTALKLLLRATSPMAIARFEREVQLSCRLTHPNTISIYDFGRTPEGVFFYAMELLNGASVAQVVKGFGPMPAARVSRVLQQLCGSLTEAHNQGLVHRDVKPSNIQLCERGGIYDTVKLLDFGLVKTTSSEESVDTTQENVILGTPSYLAPEVIRDANASSPAQDIYALGAVAYFMLTGTAVFYAPRAMDVYLQHLTQPPRPMKQFKVKVPKALNDLTLACLEKDPSNRPKNAAEVRRQLQKMAIEWTDDDAEQWWRGHDVKAEPHDPASGSTTPLDDKPKRSRKKR